MAGPFIFIANHKIKDGKIDGFKKYLNELAEFVEANEPRIIHFGGYFSDDGTEVTNVQVHLDASSMEFHMQVAGEKIGQAYEFLDGTSSIQIYGTLNDAFLGMMRQVAGPDVPVIVKSDYSGFNRI